MRVFRYGFPDKKNEYTINDLSVLAAEYLSLEDESSIIIQDRHYHVEQGTGAVTVLSYDETLEAVENRLAAIRKIFTHNKTEIEDVIQKEDIMKALYHLHDELLKPAQFRSKQHYLKEFESFQTSKTEQYYHEVAVMLANIKDGIHDKKTATE